MTSEVADQPTYITRTKRRGRPRGPYRNAATIQPTAVAGEIAPRPAAEACRSFFTTNGSSTFRAAGAAFITPAISSVAHNHVRTRTNVKPSRNSRRTDRPGCGANGRGVSISAVAVEAQNVAA